MCIIYCVPPMFSITYVDLVCFPYYMFLPFPPVLTIKPTLLQLLLSVESESLTPLTLCFPKVICEHRSSLSAQILGSTDHNLV